MQQILFVAPNTIHKKTRNKLKKSPAGRKPLDEILLFKALIFLGVYII